MRISPRSYKSLYPIYYWSVWEIFFDIFHMVYYIKGTYCHYINSICPFYVVIFPIFSHIISYIKGTYWHYINSICPFYVVKGHIVLHKFNMSLLCSKGKYWHYINSIFPFYVVIFSMKFLLCRGYKLDIMLICPL